ncbi:MAG TPA: hypothetical protein VFZ75_11140 [Actinomycetota bacterium]|nr:hypothetical protein [Actinomycetota bacterium]
MSPLRIEFHHPPEPVEAPPPTQPGPPPPPPPPIPAVASATWQDGRAIVESDDPELRAAIHRAFRPTPVVVDDPSQRYPGTSGELVLQPGDLAWFRGVALARVPAETGLVPRFVPGVRVGGYDPAANYRRFSEQVERLETSASSDV